MKSLLVLLNFVFTNKQVNPNNLTYCFLEVFFWAPIPVSRYEIRSGYGPDTGVGENEEAYRKRSSTKTSGKGNFIRFELKNEQNQLNVHKLQ